MAESYTEEQQGDSLENTITLETLLEWHEDFEDATETESDMRCQAYDYKDNIQWTDDEKTELTKRGQPIVTANQIAPKINFILGSEIRSRTDPKALPRTNNEDEAAEAVTDALRYVADDTKFNSQRSEIAEDVFVGGLGGIMLGVEEEINSKGEKNYRITAYGASWSEIFYDPKSKKKDFSDAKYLGIAKQWDLEDAKADPQYSKKKDILEETAINTASIGSVHQDRPSHWYDAKRKRILICEAYYQVGGEWWVCHYTVSGFLVDPVKVPLKTDKGQSWCPFIPCSGYVTKGSPENANRRYGIVSGLISLQDEINKRRSLALFMLMSRQILAEEGAVENPATLQGQLSNPDGVGIVREGRLRDGSVQISKNSDLAAGQMQLLAEAKQEINDIGPSLANIAGDTGSRSGIAMARQQNIGSLELEPLMENLRDWAGRVYKGFWYLIRQYWTYETWLRVQDSDARSGYRFVGLNRKMTRAQRLAELQQKGVPVEKALGMLGLADFEVRAIQERSMMQAEQVVLAEMVKAGIDPAKLPPEMQEQAKKNIDDMAVKIGLSSPEMQEQLDVNAVGQLGMDITIEHSPDVSTLQQEQFDTLADMAAKGVFVQAPAVAVAMIEASTLRNKKQLIDKLEQKEDPAAAQMAQAQMQMQVQSMQAQLAKLVAEVDNVKADTELKLAKADVEGPKALSEVAYAANSMMTAGKNSIPSPIPAQGMMRESAKGKGQ